MISLACLLFVMFWSWVLMLGLTFGLGVECWLLFFFLEMWIPGLHRMILQNYSWIAGSKNSTTSKNGMNVTKEKCISVKCSSKIELFMDQSLTTSEITSLSIQLYLLAQLERSASSGRLMIFWEATFHFGQELMPTVAAKNNYLNFHMHSNKISILLAMLLCLKGWEIWFFFYI